MGAVISPFGAAGTSLGPLAADYGFSLATIDVAEAPTAYGVTNGNLLLVLCNAPKSKSLTKLGCWVTSAGVTSTGTCGMGLYSEAGVQLGATGDMSAALATGGFQTGTLTASVNIVAGTNYYLALLAHFTTPPNIAGTVNAAANLPTINNHQRSLFTTGNTNLPASFTPGSATQNSAAYFLTAS